MEAWDDLERAQSRVLECISNLELALLNRRFCPSPFSVSGQPSPSLAVADSDSGSGSGSGSGTEARLSVILGSNGVADFAFKRVVRGEAEDPRRALHRSPLQEHRHGEWRFTCCLSLSEVG
ncbi:hypothetical protein ACJRO7_019507 [Eucalyptus globulus]|uniref:Uncharacterized protein n=1 Tax=Eucalyptus globulus TaxID=34317 RepID=A0ABD3KDD4_EUCGL